MKEGTVYQPSSTIDLDLTDIESRLFHYLLNRQEQTCRYEAIWQAVWHDEPLPDAESTRRRIQVVVSRLKPKLSEQGFDLISVRKQGYRLTSTSPA